MCSTHTCLPYTINTVTVDYTNIKVLHTRHTLTHVVFTPLTARPNKVRAAKSFWNHSFIASNLSPDSTISDTFGKS